MAEIFRVKVGQNLKFGVRVLQCTVEKLIQILLSYMIHSGELKKYIYRQLIIHNGGMSIEKSQI